MKTNLILKSVIVLLLAVIAVLGYKLNEERRWSAILITANSMLGHDLKTIEADLKESQSRVDVIAEKVREMGLSNPAPSMKQFKDPEVDNKLRDCGIAERMLDHVKLHNGSLLPPVTFGIEKCSFWIEVVGNTISAVMEMPNPNPINLDKTPRVQELFSIEEGKHFGASDEPPLSPEQIALVQQIIGS